MLKSRNGREYRLTKPNPLTREMSEPWKEEELVLYNSEHVGSSFKREIGDGDANLDRIGEDLAIRNQDGSLYELKGDLRMFDPANPDQDLMHSIDQEDIELSGSPIYYYKVFIDDNNYDDLYMESRNKVRAQHAVELYAHWEPVTPTNDLGSFGIDSPDEVTFSFNIREFKEKTGDDLPDVGALIYTPFDKNWWEIIQYNHGGAGEGFKIWGKYRFAVLTRKYQESMTDVEPTRPEPSQGARDIIIR